MLKVTKSGMTLLIITVSWLLSFSTVEACTGIKLIQKDGSIIHGRTLEFGVVVDTSVVVIPRGFEFKGTTPKGPGLAYKAKYASVGSIAFDDMAIMDGINEKGLSVGTFYFPGFAGYSEITSENQSKGLSPVEFSNWIVTQFETIDEVKNSLNSVVIAPTVTKEWGSAPAPFHYIVFEKNGRSLVIEPIDGKLMTYENPLGVFTNSPTFDWHMENLRNYINLTVANIKPVKIGKLELAPFGQGSGMVGMPGDFTPPSRFVRAAIFSTSALPSNNANEGVFQAFHILNQFDIPVGVAREKIDDTIYSDYTLVTCVRDPQSLKYYFRTYEDQNIKFVDLNKFDLNAKTIKRANTTGKEKAIDISSKLN
ncbi:MAG: choloylglycine hydrolase family protein [Parachlamydiaceae bacterium]|nr:choloylglycine hydrolase family protein [Parachlamydiaceae bacterium]